MNIQWTTTNDLGESVTETHPVVNTANAFTYAKNNCRKCHGRGYATYDNGWEYFTVKEEGKPWYQDRKRYNERAILCDCAIRTIQRSGL